MNRGKFTVALDMDSCVYDLSTPWLEYLRKELNEDVSEGFKMWDTHIQYPKSGTRVYRFLELGGTFYSLKLIPGAQEAINKVHEMGVRQFFISTCTTATGAWEKQQRIAKDFPFLKKSVLITSGDKDLIFAHMLVDDGPHNLDAFAPHGVTVKVPYPYNETTPADITMPDWSMYTEIVRQEWDRWAGVQRTCYDAEVLAALEGR
jgi:5'(3')-deoxyribonucleotidase